jgi:DNA-binding NtrC family response regulator
MSPRAEMLVFGCREDDLAVLRSASGATGPVPLTVESPAELARRVIERRPVAVVLGVATPTLAHLDLIPVIRAARGDLPVIIIGEEDSLELERSARQRSIFYYLVHPIERAEVEAVLKNVLRCKV